MKQYLNFTFFVLLFLKLKLYSLFVLKVSSFNSYFLKIWSCINMEDEKFGETFKFIRKSRGLSQDYVARNIVSRTSISKIENGKQTPSISKAYSLIKNLGLEADEFLYIQNNYKRDLKSSILHQFMNLSETTQAESISHVVNECKKYLSNYFDVQISHIFIVLQSLKSYENGEEFSKIEERLKPVWEDLSKLDTWLTIDLFIINNILYFFPINTSYNMTKQSLKTIENKYPYLLRLKNAFNLNISYLLMRENLFEQATKFLSESMELSKIIKRYDLLLIAKIRLSIINNNFEQIQEYYNLLVEIGAEELAFGVKKEVKQAFNMTII